MDSNLQFYHYLTYIWHLCHESQATCIICEVTFPLLVSEISIHGFQFPVLLFSISLTSVSYWIQDVYHVYLSLLLCTIILHTQYINVEKISYPSMRGHLSIEIFRDLNPRFPISSFTILSPRSAFTWHLLLIITKSSHISVFQSGSSHPCEHPCEQITLTDPSFWM